jgi:hypothetical protein
MNEKNKHDKECWRKYLSLQLKRSGFSMLFFALSLLLFYFAFQTFPAAAFLFRFPDIPGGSPKPKNSREDRDAPLANHGR